jgi:hypothetical protein
MIFAGAQIMSEPDQLCQKLRLQKKMGAEKDAGLASRG